jgi:hypothetical protein
VLIINCVKTAPFVLCNSVLDDIKHRVTLHNSHNIMHDVKFNVVTNPTRGADTQLGDDGDVDRAMGNVMPCE